MFPIAALGVFNRSHIDIVMHCKKVCFSRMKSYHAQHLYTIELPGLFRMMMIMYDVVIKKLKSFFALNFRMILNGNMICTKIAKMKYRNYLNFRILAK